MPIDKVNPDVLNLFYGHLKDCPVVKKIWGEEYWIINNFQYCFKLLNISPYYECSLHRHLVKDETFLCLSGIVYLEIANEFRVLRPGNQHRIMPQTWHRFSSFTGAVVLEISTYHDDKDVERLEPSRAIY